MHELERLLRAVHLATSKLVSQDDLKVVLREVLAICVEAVGAYGGTMYLHEPATKTLRFLHVLPEEIERRLERLDLPDDYGIAGEVFLSGRAQVSDFPEGGDPDRTMIRRKTGVTVRTMITVPLQIDGMPPIGIVQLVNKQTGSFDDNDEAVLDTICDVATLAIVNSRLLEQRTRVAGLEGMGRAAHDLANKAGALLTFMPEFERNLDALRQALTEQKASSEAMFYLDMLDGTYRDVFAPYSERVFRYARLINDLAAGKKLEPKLKSQNFALVVEQTAQFLETTARRNFVRIVYDLQRDAPDFEFDDLYIMRIVENLVGNAIKAVRETVPEDWVRQNEDDLDAVFGTVTVRYRHVPGHHVLEVMDAGPGMSPATVRQILTGQAKSSWGQNSGSGLGTKAVLELANAHGAKLSIKSRLGEGSTFELDFPEPIPAAATPRTKGQPQVT